MNFSVYFSSKEVSGKCVLCVKVLDGYEVLPEVVKEIKRFNGTQYERELLAFKLALQTILDEEYDDVTLLNQNKLLFEWLVKGTKHSNNLRQTLYNQINELMNEIVDSQIKIGYKIVKGKDNLAKKYLDKHTDVFNDSVDLTSKFGTSARGNVINFSREAR